MKSLWKVAHFSYWAMKHWFKDDRHNCFWVFFVNYQLGITLYAFLRCSFLYALTQQHPPPSWYLPYDVYAYLFVNYSENYDPAVLAVILLLESFVAYCLSKLYRLPSKSYILLWFYQMMVQNQDDATSSIYKETIQKRLQLRQTTRLLGSFQRHFCHFSKTIPKVFQKEIASFLVKIRFWIQFDKLNKSSFNQKTLSVHPNLSFALRKRTLLILEIVDQIGNLMQFLIILMAFALAEVVYRQVGPGSSSPSNPQLDGVGWPALCLVIVEYPLLYGQVVVLLYLAAFFTLCVNIAVMVNVHHCRTICRQVKGDLGKLRSGRLTLSGFQQNLSSFLNEFYRCIGIAIYGNSELFASLLFAFLLTSAPVNIYFVQRLVFYRNNPTELAICWLVAGLQGLALYAVVGPLANHGVTMNRPMRFLSHAQWTLTGRGVCLPLKLKLNGLHFRLAAHPPITISVGPFSGVTYAFIVRFLCQYTSYLLLTFSMQMNQCSNCK